MMRTIARTALLMTAISTVLIFAATRRDAPTPAAAAPGTTTVKKSDPLPHTDFRDRFIAPSASTIKAETIPEHKTTPTTRQKPKDVCQRHGMTKKKTRRGWRCR